MIGLKSKTKTIEQITAPIGAIVKQLQDLYTNSMVEYSLHTDAALRSQELAAEKSKVAREASVLAEKYSKLLS